jgi:tetratricopeptide (TPR) repeat protein
MERGTRVADRFEIIAQAGAGGMGEVYRAMDTITGEQVALKLLRDASAHGDRFAREARVLAELNHPAVVRYIAHGAGDHGARWIAMEWLEGEDLAHRLDRDDLSAEESVELARRVAGALAAAHARGIVHRDVKPSNLFLSGGAVAGVKLLDFGIARAHGGLRTRTGAAMGTPGYMAPEQVRGERDIDARADVFALGCVLYECLAGEPAFASENVVAVLGKVLLDDVAPLDELRPEIPSDLAALVARMLSKDRALRPRDGGEAEQALAALGATTSVGRRARKPAVASLGAGEQRLVTVALSSHDDLDLNTHEARTLGPADDAELARLRAQARAQGATIDRLADGTLLAVATGSAAIDRCARIALSLAESPGARVALATGRALVGDRMPMGEVVDRAAAMLRHATGGVLLDPLSEQLLDPRFEIRGDGGARVLLRERAADHDAHTLMGRATPCVGRERELRALEEYLRECIDEPLGRPVVIIAPPGVGKSRLAHELVRAVRARDASIEVWTGRADPTRSGAPLWTLSQAIASAAGLKDGEPLETRQAKLRARVELHVEPAHRERITVFLGEITGTRFADDGYPPLRTARRDAAVMADQTRRAWEDFVAAECDRHPVVLVLEDLHWGDAATVSYVDSALRNLGERPWMILALARPEVLSQFPNLWKERGGQHIRLDGLSRKASERLVREVLGERAHDAAVARIVGRAAGNAFFLEELIRAIGDGEDVVPETVLGVVEQRLATLDGESRRVLRAASLFGETFWAGAVRSLIGGGDPDEALRVLADAEFIQPEAESRHPGEREYVFRHDLVRVAAYAMLTERDRSLGHSLAGEWLERAGERDALVVAEHYDRGGASARAVPWHLRAARQALEANDYGAAVARAERGVASGAEGETLGRLRLLQAEAHQYTGELPDLLARARSALELVAPASDVWLEAIRWAIDGACAIGSLDEALALVARLESATVPAELALDRAHALMSAALRFVSAGRPDVASRLEAAAGVISDDRTRAWQLRLRARDAMLAGDSYAVAQAFQAAREHCERAGDMRRACTELANVGYSFVQLGEIERAEITLKGALAEGRRMGLRRVEAAALHNLGRVLGWTDRLDEAIRTESEAVSAFVAQSDRRLEGAARVYLAEILLTARDTTRALAEVRRAVELLEGESPVRPYALAVLARALRARGDTAAANAAIAEAMRGLDQLEEGEAVVRLTHAELLLDGGEVNASAARAAIATAHDRLMARAAAISDEPTRRSFLTRVPENARTVALAGSIF